MKTDHRSFAALCTALLAGAALLVGCSSSPTSVDTDMTAPTAQFSQATGCPTVEEATTSIVAELDANCPRTASYRHWGELNSCEKSTIGQWLDSYDHCFSKSEVKEIRVRVYEMRHSAGTSTGGGDKTSPEPIPTEN